MSGPTANWKKLYDRYYEMIQLYKMDWEGVSLPKYLVVGAPFGGPIAMILDSRRMFQLGPEDAAHRKRIRVFTSAGKPIAEIPFSDGEVVQLGWTAEENIVCVLADGTVSILSMHGERVSGFSMGAQCAQDGVAEAHLWPEGVVVRTAATSQLYWSTFDRPRPVRLADPGLDAPPTSMAVVRPPPQSALFAQQGSKAAAVLEQQDGPRVLLGTKERSLLLVDRFGVTDLRLQTGPFSAMRASSNGALLACFNDDGMLYVIETGLGEGSGAAAGGGGNQFKRVHTEFDTKRRTPPRLEWCGTDNAVLLYWERERLLVVVGPKGEPLTYEYETPVVLVPECDGARILSPSSCEFLRLVPDSVASIFEVASISAPALLFDALQAYERGEVKADEHIRSITKQRELDHAVEACLIAAANEFNLDRQKRLLDAASFGKLCSDTFKADEFVDTCRILRVLNAVRGHDIGLPISYPQFQRLGVNTLVDRLINRHEHLLALRVCDHLRMKTEKVLIHWASTKIKYAAVELEKHGEDAKGNALTTEKLAGQLLVKLRLCPGMSMEPIASAAYRHGLQELATMLLQHEPRAEDQVSLLLGMSRSQLALDKAVQSGDPDLIFQALFHIRELSASEPEFVRSLLSARPAARLLWQSYCRKHDLPGLRGFCRTSGDHLGDAQAALLVAYTTAQTLPDRLGFLEYAGTACRQVLAGAAGGSSSAAGIGAAVAAAGGAAAAAAEDRASAAFLAQAIQEQTELVRIQQRLQNQDLAGNADFMDLSVSEFIEVLLTRGDMEQARNVAKQFQVSEKRFWHIQVRTLAKSGQWELLEKLARSKKQPPIGWTPFVEACAEQRNPAEATKYIARLPDHSEQMEWLCNLGQWAEAAEIAAQKKDGDALRVIRARCNDPRVVVQIERALAELR